jgi:hypothetical protein
VLKTVWQKCLYSSNELLGLMDKEGSTTYKYCCPIKNCPEGCVELAYIAEPPFRCKLHTDKEMILMK